PDRRVDGLGGARAAPCEGRQERRRRPDFQAGLRGSGLASGRRIPEVSRFLPASQCFLTSQSFLTLPVGCTPLEASGSTGKSEEIGKCDVRCVNDARQVPRYLGNSTAPLDPKNTQPSSAVSACWATDARSIRCTP